MKMEMDPKKGKKMEKKRNTRKRKKKLEVKKMKILEKRKKKLKKKKKKKGENSEEELEKKERKLRRKNRKLRKALKLGIEGKQPITGESEIYFIGIIDCLTPYLFGKKLAYFFKQIIWQPETLSTIEADKYAERFSNFMKEDLIFDPERHTEEILEEPSVSDDSIEEKDERDETVPKSARGVRRKTFTEHELQKSDSRKKKGRSQSNGKRPRNTSLSSRDKDVPDDL